MTALPPSPLAAEGKARRDWFAMVLAAAVAAAWFAPRFGRAGGPLHPEHSVSAAVSLVFFACGLSLPTRSLALAAQQWRLHVFIQTFVFLVVPLIVVLAMPGMAALRLPVTVKHGFLVLACLPSTMTSSVVFTRAAAGNDAAALCNAVLGSLLGIVLTPALIALLIGFDSDFPAPRVIRDLALLVAAPIAIGQIVGGILPAMRVRLAGMLRIVPMACIVFIVYTVFCTAFIANAEQPSMSARALIATLACVCGLHAVVLVSCWLLSRMAVLQLSWEDRVGALFCGTQKSIALGLPLITMMFRQHTDALSAGDVAWISLPLMAYHPLQSVVAGMMVPWLKKGPASGVRRPASKTS